MRTLADRIEEYLKKRLAESPRGILEVQRQELALLFACVPSQINYVLGTRFTLTQGYLVESRRGGGGYVRIVRLPLDVQHLAALLAEKPLSQQAAEGIIARLEEEGIVGRREAMLMQAVLDREVLGVELPTRDFLRARLLRAMLLTILREDF
ncbi:MAG: CtsR family transcriptional regulator [Clostridia bacterium]|nr:CtsR family transcriptional regulator [Clostridia bacterium]